MHSFIIRERTGPESQRTQPAKCTLLQFAVDTSDVALLCDKQPEWNLTSNQGQWSPFPHRKGGTSVPHNGGAGLLLFFYMRLCDLYFCKSNKHPWVVVVKWKTIQHIRFAQFSYTPEKLLLTILKALIEKSKAACDEAGALFSPDSSIMQLLLIQHCFYVLTVIVKSTLARSES